MPTYYKAIVDHQPVKFGGELERIEMELADLRCPMRTLFDRWCGIELNDEKLRALLESVRYSLVRFALDCNAIPLRTSRKLMATVKRISKHPADFLRWTHSVGPLEAVS
jgi:hypothetical protein